jgi:endonuclease/exonuclease/phosphatase family metal-dependent hydrolase
MVALKVASWNVRHFRGEPIRFDRVVDTLVAKSPDVFAIYEVTGRDVYRLMRNLMPEYSVSITEGEQAQEILVGARIGLQPFFTQRPDLRSGVDALRPGALVTVTANGAEYSLLFLHNKSGTAPRDLGLRDDMVRKAFKLGRALDRAAGDNAPANYLFIGDLNTMGMEYTHLRSMDIDEETELEKLKRFATSRDMRLLAKDAPATWWGGTDTYDPADLDHVVAATHLNFTTFPGVDRQGNPVQAEVTVKGWPERDGQERLDWIRDHSDHGLLYLEIL